MAHRDRHKIEGGAREIGKDPGRARERRRGAGYQGREPEGEGSVSVGTVVILEMTAHDSRVC